MNNRDVLDKLIIKVNREYERTVDKMILSSTIEDLRKKFDDATDRTMVCRSVIHCLESWKLRNTEEERKELTYLLNMDNLIDEIYSAKYPLGRTSIPEIISTEYIYDIVDNLIERMYGNEF